MNEITDELNDTVEDEQQNNGYERYDASFKLNCVEEFLELKKKDPKHTGYGSYAKSKGINKNTFTFWVRKYLEDKDRYRSAKTNEVILSDNKPQFIRLSESQVKPFNSSDDDKVNLTIDGMSLSFGIDNLEKVLSVLRR